jgi:predicted transglutaminase-like cysteine proteinase
MLEKGSGGIFTKFRLLLERNRLGELLVLKGALTPRELRLALARQKEDGASLGHVLVRHKLLSRPALYRALAEQWTLRSLAAVASFTIVLSCAGAKSARAASIRDIPPQISLVSAANAAFAPVKAYPALFGTTEQSSGNLEPFTKWINMFSRFSAAMETPQGHEVAKNWKAELARYEGLPLRTMAEKVNSMINQETYIVDSRNWGQSDYWETPIEFFTKGGDCEDFAIAKYVSLRALGVPEERLRVAIVHDLKKDIPHAVLIVYTDSGALILDNQADQVRSSDMVTRYRPIFSINRQAWWLHTPPKTTVLASAQ